jgi:ribosome-binding protein aMBF1 (putative translation factor)
MKKTHKPYYDPTPFFKKLERDPEVKILIKQQEEKFHLAMAIKKAREHAGLSQVALAKKIGTKQSAISRVESGVYRSVPSLIFLQKIAAACGAHLGITFDFRKAS